MLLPYVTKELHSTLPVIACAMFETKSCHVMLDSCYSLADFDRTLNSNKAFEMADRPKSYYFGILSNIYLETVQP